MKVGLPSELSIGKQPRMSDSYVETLGQMIDLFQNYKPGLITLDNVTRLCQTLGLESFIDILDNDISRLSTASKIIVIDIDYQKSKRKVKDVKLVLASNFDNFNYYNDGDKSNILFNSLDVFPDLHAFYHNLKFLTLLDNYSQIEADSDGSNKNGKFDLFKYFTELFSFLSTYLQDRPLKFNVKANVDNQFGIFIYHEQVCVAKVVLEQSTDPEHRLYEYAFQNDEWINENLQNFTSGVALTLEIVPEVYFPQELVASELLIELDADRPFAIQNHHQRIQLFNDFTSELIPARKFNISNDNLDLLYEILKWVNWWHQVFFPVLSTLKCPQTHPSVESKRRSSSTSTSNSTLRRASFARRRRSSAKGRRPSINESKILKDEGMQQFTLNEIMNQPVLDENDEDLQKVYDLVINEDYLYLQEVGSCGFHGDPAQWGVFKSEFSSRFM
ncbi:LAFE_0D09098g1_1 [Lachancea fermentati]|uniref:Mediator of RNA polymerase II transcription subunit 1 n=1 Tax=Lachancea fermentati TaxID=4955 RepID=A0A1G4MBR8_LACFM|nr:LAFE_0D09098g1_1 [Lachancea fermentati]